MLAEIPDPDLFEWCVMYLDDESSDVRVAALHAMLRCDHGDSEVIVPLAASEDKRVRAAAIAALAKHSGDDAPYWLSRGLKDPCSCVRVAAAGLLSELDPAKHRDVFELALYDHNREITRRAQKLTSGKGYARLKW